MASAAVKTNRCQTCCFTCCIPNDTIVIINTIQTTAGFDAWFDGLPDRKAKARIQVRIDRAEEGNFGDCQPVGKGVSEMRIHYGAGYRVYFKRFGREWVIVLAGGDKSTQQADIKTALKLARELEG